MFHSSQFNQESLAAFSSIGLTVDGRLKPDIAAPGSYVTSANAQTGVGSHCSIKAMEGTSMAAPVVAGHAAKIRNNFLLIFDCLQLESTRFQVNALLRTRGCCRNRSPQTKKAAGAAFLFCFKTLIQFDFVRQASLERLHAAQMIHLFVVPVRITKHFLHYFILGFTTQFLHEFLKRIFLVRKALNAIAFQTYFFRRYLNGRFKSAVHVNKSKSLGIHTRPNASLCK
jgi:hypothetical protein